MDRETFLRLARQVFVRMPDEWEEERKAVHEHIETFLWRLYKNIEKLVRHKEKFYVPRVAEIEEMAWETWSKEEC